MQGLISTGSNSFGRF